MMGNETPFKLRIDLSVLEHLGINLYSNVPSVLSEIVANSWDADATEVRIDWDLEEDRIVIQDDGIGMTREDVNARFLTVGYQRRSEQPGPTARKRRPMGRKGIGKLSVFSIADSAQIETSKDGTHSAFRMHLKAIREKISKEGGNGTYEPEEVRDARFDLKHGTRITLSELRRRQTIKTPRDLRKRVARRFSILGAAYDFHVFINNEEVVPADRGYYDKIQFLWTYGDSLNVRDLCKSRKSDEDRTDTARGMDISVIGWLGTVAESKQLKDEDGDNLNRIAIFVRGKMAQENMLDDFSERGVYANYLIGELRFDDLDTYDGGGTSCDEDAATSSRQRIVEDDPRYQELRRFLGNELKYIQNRWKELRSKAGTQKALEIPTVKEWMDALKPPTRKKAEKWLGKINRIDIDDLEEHKHLIKQSMIAFEFLRVNEKLDALDSIHDENLSVVLNISQDMDNIEASLYSQIIRQRLGVIEAFQKKIEENELEKLIQRYLFDHLWLIDPSWERVEGTEIMERSVKKLFLEVDNNLPKNVLEGRLDIKYRKSAGQHVILELKRPDRRIKISELSDQVSRYREGMRALLDDTNTPHEPIEIIVLLGKKPGGWDSTDKRNRDVTSLSAYDARVVFYEELLHNARKVYREFLERRKQIDKFAKLIQDIDDYAPPPSS